MSPIDPLNLSVAEAALLLSKASGKAVGEEQVREAVEAGCPAGADAARGIGQADWWRPAWTARLAGRADLGAVVAARQAVAFGIDRDGMGSGAPARLAIHAPGAAKGTAWFDLHPIRRREPLPVGWVFNSVASNRMPTAFGLECERTAEILAAFFQARQFYIAALNNCPEAIWPNILGPDQTQGQWK